MVLFSISSVLYAKKRKILKI
ncbi:hypothetical protein I8748_06790 [Nostoc sp. CENA67]|uniref:Uncharacterized protein n=1 Tax=Amazonocrinis nigriterrae CENA67 TaxID=2794033 RepID=A0A8J7HMA8_9NOST|nr:hypothetical protein [Amazonocrinis nigriterrae CENA67]